VAGDKWQAECDTATTGRLTVAMLAPVVTAYEHAMTSGEGRNTWRTDRYSPCPRARAGQYLAFLASLGYQPSDIEQAVADSVSWTGDGPDTPLEPSAELPPDDPDQNDSAADDIDEAEVYGDGAVDPAA
jgi:hypothetical protein